MGSHFVSFVAALVLSGLVSSAVAIDSMEVLVAGDAIVANRDVTTEGIVFGLTAIEVQGLIEAQMEFRRKHEAQIEAIADDLNLDRCTVAETLRGLALEGTHGKSPTGLAADPSGAETSSEKETAGQDADRRVESAGAGGDVEQARKMLVSIGRGIVAGRDVKVAGDIVFGIPKKEFTDLIVELGKQDVAYAQKFQRLRTDLNVNRCATASFLDALGENQVPVDQLHQRLQQIAEDHLKLVSQWASVTESDPQIAGLRSRAKISIENGDYVRAEELLKEASEKMRAKVDPTSAVRADFAKVEADRGRLSLVRMKYADAALAFEKARAYAVTAQAIQEAIRYLELEAGAYQDAGDYQKAEAAFSDALDKLESSAPDDLLRIAKYYNNLGTLLFARSEYEEAAEMFALARETAHGAGDTEPTEKSLQVAVSLNGSGDAAMARSLLEEAEGHYREALDIMVEAFGPDDHRLMNLLTNLARLTGDRGNFEEAEELYERALALDRAGRPINAPELAATKSNFAAFHFDKGDIEKAEELWQEAYEVYVAALGEDHVVTLGVLMNLGNVHRTKGRVYGKEDDLCEAEGIYLRALEVWDRNSKRRRGHKKMVSADHLLMASAHRSLAHVYVNQDKLEKVKKLQIECNLGSERWDAQGKLEGAESHYREARAIVEKRFDDMEPKDHPLYMGLTSDLAVLSERRGDYQRALMEFKEAGELFGEKLGKAHPDYGTVISNLARVHRRLGQLDQAEELYLSAIEISEATGDQLTVAYRNTALALVYRKQGRLDLARRCLEEAYRIYDEELGKEHGKTKKVTRLLEELASEPTS